MYSRIDDFSFEIRNKDLETALGVFGETKFVAWTPTRGIDSNCLRYQGDKCSRSGKDVRSIISNGTGIHIESGENLTRRRIETEDDLNVP
jgi:hypothetical protein